MRKGHFQKTGSKFYLLTVFLVFFSVYSNQNNLFAQISIRETVALNPKTLNTEGPDYDILTLDDYLCLDEQTFIVISAEVDFFELYQDSVITLEIISGNKSASFYGMSSFAGDTVSILIRRLDYIRIQHDSSGGSSATIKATINNVVRTTDVYLSCGGGGEGECSLETYPLANTNTLYPGESFMMGAELFGSCPDQDPDFSYNVRIIQGSAYGTLLNIYTGEKADQFNGIQPYDLNWLNFLFLADGEVPESSKEVKIQISTNNPLFPSSNLSLIVNPSIEPMIQIVPSVLEPGDTADVYIKNRNDDLSLSDFPPEATFEVGMLDGCVNGTILTEEGTGSYFIDVPLPIKFIAADTGTVKLRAGVLPMSGGASISVKGKEHVFDLKEIYKRLHSSVNMEKQKVNKSIKSSADINEDACYTGPFWSFLSGDVVVEIGTPELEIISPEKNSIAWITEEPKMPEVICKARLKHYAGEVIFNWEYEVSYEYPRWHYPSGSQICTRKSKTKFFEPKEDLSLGDIVTEWKVPFTNADASFEYIASNFRDGCSSVIDTWTQGSDIFTGGNIKITLVAMSPSGRFLARTELSGPKLLGKNPGIQKIHEHAASNEIKAILIHEARSVHFTGDEIASKFWRPYYEKGFPLYGPPNGYGLMQLDNPGASEKELWSWKANLDEGKRLYFEEKKPMAINYLNRHKDWLDARPELKEEYYLKCAFQKYNGGIDKNGKPTYYWRWKKEGSGGWIKNDELEGDYGGKVYNIYKSLN